MSDDNNAELVQRQDSPAPLEQSRLNSEVPHPQIIVGDLDNGSPEASGAFSGGSTPPSPISTGGLDNGSPAALETAGGGSTPPLPKLEIVPCSLTRANEYVDDKHRHNGPLRSFYVFSIGAAVGDKLVGVALVGHASNKSFEDGETLEVRRVATDGTKNANSMLYAACVRAAKAMGYHRLITYTLPEESGASLRAAGWKDDGVRDHHATVTNPHAAAAIRDGITYPLGPKRRWFIRF